MPQPHSTRVHPPGGQPDAAAATLRAAREAQGRALSELAEKLQLSAADLEELERQDDPTIVGSVHTMARLRVYARELGLDPERMLTGALQARQAQAREPQTRETQPPQPQTRETQPRETQTPEPQPPETQPRETQPPEPQPREAPAPAAAAASQPPPAEPAPDTRAPGDGPLPPPPPPPREPENRRSRVSASALLATLGVVVVFGVAAAVVVMSNQPFSSVQLTNPISDQAGEGTEGGDPAEGNGADPELSTGDGGGQTGLSSEGDGGQRGPGDADGDGDGQTGLSSEGSGGQRGPGDGDGVAGDPGTDGQGTLSPSSETRSDSDRFGTADTEGGEGISEMPAARPPGETGVQVLDGAADPEGVDEIVALLEDHGYVVAAVNATSKPYEESAVYATDGWEDEAEALAARETGLVVGEPNPGFSEEIPLHVVVGTDWSP